MLIIPYLKDYFFFRELEDNNFHIFEKNKNIKELISKISEKNNENEMRNVNVINNDMNMDNTNNNESSGIKVFKIKKKILKGSRRSNNQLHVTSFENKTINEKSSNTKILKPNNIYKNSNDKNTIYNIKSDKNNEVSYNIRYDHLQNIEYLPRRTNDKIISYNFNIFEIIINQIFPCCMTKKIRTKK